LQSGTYPILRVSGPLARVTVVSHANGYEERTPHRGNQAMDRNPGSLLAQVTYRANLRDGAEVELLVFAFPDSASVTDAWMRLTKAYGAVDPHSLEIEVRSTPLAALLAARTRGRPTPPRWDALERLQSSRDQNAW
jgi:hypothetical protein